jgi:hypothetical protein
MNCNQGTTLERDICLENFAAELTEIALPVALRHGIAGSWLDLELDLWKVLTDRVKKSGRESRPPRTQAE